MSRSRNSYFLTDSFLPTAPSNFFIFNFFWEQPKLVPASPTHNFCFLRFVCKNSKIMFFQFASTLASYVRLVRTSIRPVCYTWGRHYYCECRGDWRLEYGKYSEYKNVLSETLASEAERVQCAEGAIFDSLSDGICMARDAAECYLRNRARKITTFEEIAQVATTAAGGDREIGEIVAKVKTTVGDKAKILICDEDGKTPFIEFDSYNEMVLHQWAPISQYFCTNDVLRNPLILIHEKKISNFDIVKLAIGQAMQSSRPLLIVADDILWQRRLVMETRFVSSYLTGRKTIGRTSWRTLLSSQEARF